MSNYDLQKYGTKGILFSSQTPETSKSILSVVYRGAFTLQLKRNGQPDTDAVSVIISYERIGNTVTCKFETSWVPNGTMIAPVQLIGRDDGQGYVPPELRPSLLGIYTPFLFSYHNQTDQMAAILSMEVSGTVRIAPIPPYSPAAGSVVAIEGFTIAPGTCFTYNIL